MFIIYLYGNAAAETGFSLYAAFKLAEENGIYNQKFIPCVRLYASVKYSAYVNGEDKKIQIVGRGLCTFRPTPKDYF